MSPRSLLVLKFIPLLKNLDEIKEEEVGEIE
jgi:hypothetical protein